MIITEASTASTSSKFDVALEKARRLIAARAEGATLECDVRNAALALSHEASRAPSEDLKKELTKQAQRLRATLAGPPPISDSIKRGHKPTSTRQASIERLKAALAKVAWCSSVEKAAALIIKEVFCGAVFHDRSLSLTLSRLGRFFELSLRGLD